MRDYSGFYQGLSGYCIHELHCGIVAYEKSYFASIFKRLWRENEAFQGQSPIIQSSIIHYTQKAKKSFCGAKVVEGPETPESSQCQGPLCGH